MCSQASRLSDTKDMVRRGNIRSIRYSNLVRFRLRAVSNDAPVNSRIPYQTPITVSMASMDSLVRRAISRILMVIRRRETRELTPAPHPSIIRPLSPLRCLLRILARQRSIIHHHRHLSFMHLLRRRYLLLTRVPRLSITRPVNHLPHIQVNRQLRIPVATFNLPRTDIFLSTAVILTLIPPPNLPSPLQRRTPQASLQRMCLRLIRTLALVPPRRRRANLSGRCQRVLPSHTRQNPFMPPVALPRHQARRSTLHNNKLDTTNSSILKDSHFHYRQARERRSPLTLCHQVVTSSFNNLCNLLHRAVLKAVLTSPPWRCLEVPRDFMARLPHPMHLISRDTLVLSLLLVPTINIISSTKTLSKERHFQQVSHQDHLPVLLQTRQQTHLPRRDLPYTLVRPTRLTEVAIR